MLQIRPSLPRVDFGAYRRILRVLGGHLVPHRRRLVASAVASLGVSLVTLAQPWPLKVVFDVVLAPSREARAGWLGSWLASRDPMTVVAWAAASVLLLTILNGILSYVASIQAEITGHLVTTSIRERLFAHTQRLPQSWHDYRDSGDLMASLTSDVQLVQELLVGSLANFASQFFMIAGMLMVMLWLDPLLTLATLCTAPLFAVAAFHFSGRIRTAAHKQRKSYGRLMDSMQETLSGIAHVKGFVQEKAREKAASKSGQRDLKANVHTARIEARYQRVVEILNAVGTCVVLGLGAARVREGYMSPGDLLIFLNYLRRLFKPLQRVARSSTRASKAIVRGEKILELLAMPAEDLQAPDALPARELAGDVRFVRVHFSYRDGEAVLRDLSCSIPTGKTTLILGATGAGKSTMAKLLMRFYEPESGSILLDGRDIREYQISSLRQRITPLAQETFLFKTTIADNIAFGKRHATRDEIEAAAAFVGADAFIRRLPQGYETLVGEGGLTLSGGQRQWITFARAALRHSSVMIFDEPATGLDVQAEAETKRVLAKLSEGRTLILITHRLNFLDLADRIVFVRDGAVAEEGRLDELIEGRGELCRYLMRGREHFEAIRWLDRVVEGGGSR